MNTLLSITDVIARKHPDIMGCLKEFTNNLDDNEYKHLIVYDMGEAVGRKIFHSKYKSLKGDDSVGQALKKIVLPTVSPFTMAKIKENELHVSICPFCIHIKEIASSAQCDFLSGLICGLITPIQPVTVTEVQCRAQKASACVFLVNKKY
jgi:predicted hydrocarbon binding protein